MDQKSQNQGNFVNDLLRTEFHKYVLKVLCLVQTFTHHVTGNSWRNSSKYALLFWSQFSSTDMPLVNYDVVWILLLPLSILLFIIAEPPFQ